jgi:hypothetical protein
MTNIEKGRIASIMRRLTTASSIELGDTVDEVVKLGSSVPEELVNALAQRIEQGTYVESGAVASVVAASRNRRLFEAARQHLVKDTAALITLIRGDIPDPDIEKRLRDKLYNVFRSRLSR